MYIVRSFHKGSPGYLCLQEAVRRHYFKHYAATPDPQPDVFVCLSAPGASPPGYACAGITYGDTGKLFSEYYLNEALDKRYAINRARIAEVGAFASFCTDKGAGKYLLSNIIKTLALWNVGLVVLTATEQVRRLLASIVDNLEDLGRADCRRVKDIRVNWGNYYDHTPRVVISRLSSPSTWLMAPTPSIAHPHPVSQAMP